MFSEKSVIEVRFRFSVLGLFIVLAGILFRPETVGAKSVFAVTDHSNTVIKAYVVDSATGEIEYQEDVEAETFVNGATGLCAWLDVERMFVTYEGSSKIAWASTKTLERDTGDEIDAPESSLAGVIANETDNLLYVVTRSGGHLYTYTFDEDENTLVLVHPNDPSYPSRTYRQLEGLETGSTFGLALDEDGGALYFGFPTGLLYVANGTSTVRYYNTTTWELAGSVDMERDAVGIACDGDGHLYAGGYKPLSGSHNYLVRYDLDGDPNDIVEKNMGYAITDIVIDNDTGVLYTATRQKVAGFFLKTFWQRIRS